MTTRHSLSIVVAAVMASTPAVLAETSGHDPEFWRVTGVAADDTLNARMGPGTDYPVIEEFAADERGLGRVTCVPFHGLGQDAELTDAQLAALPPPWCLMRDADMELAGWVAQRFITLDEATPTLLEASGPSDGSDPLERLSARFLGDYEKQDPLQVLDQVLATLEPMNSQSAFLPSARIRPLTMAVLALEAAEGVRDRVRYRISYGIEQLPDQPNDIPYPVSFIQVDRFSLGSAIRQNAIESYGAEHVAPPEAFDVGPHVSWRLVTRPVQGNRSDIMAAGRTELSEAQAKTMTCLDSPCLSPVMDLESAAPWGPTEETPLNSDPVPFRVARSGLLTPAAAIDELTRDSDFGEEGRFREPPALPDPFLEAVIEINLAQDSALDAGLRRSGLMDDSVAAVWRRLIVIPVGENAQTPTAYRSKASECQRGPVFPPQGGLCP